MSKWMAVAMAGLLLTGVSVQAAQNFDYPEGDPAFSIRFPASWTAEVNDQDALEGLSSDQTVYMVLWEVEDVDNVEQEITETAEQLLSDVEFDEADEEEVTNKYDVKFWLKHGTGVDKQNDEQVQFTIAVFGITEDRAFIAMYTIESENATEEGKRQFTNIMESIRPLIEEDAAAEEETEEEE